MRLSSHCCISFPRRFGAFFLSLGLLVVGTSLTLSLAGQNPPRGQVPEEEEDPKQKAKPGTKVPQEEVAPRTEEKPGVPTLITLVADAEDAKHPAIKTLYYDLVVPHDAVTMANGSTVIVQPMATYVGTKPSFEGTIKLVPYYVKWKPGDPLQVTRPGVSGVQHYEEIAVQKIKDFLAKDFHQAPPDSKRFLSRQDMLQAAEKALARVIDYLRSGRETGVRQGAKWDEVEESLLKELRSVQLQLLRSVAASQGWGDAYEVASRLAEAYKDREFRQELIQILEPFVTESLNRERYAEVQHRMRVLDELLPNSEVLSGVNNRLEKKALEFKTKAEKAKENKNPTLAMAHLEVARQIYPRLPGLRDAQLQLSDTYPILRVGVRNLPQMMSPAMASTDAERYAVELLFDSLVEATEELVEGSLRGKYGVRYYPDLAEDRPGVVPRGRKIQLAPDAYWSNGQRVRAADVCRTVELLKSRARTYLLETPGLGGDEFQVTVPLEQGYIEPLSLMTFKILPAQAENLTKLVDPKFAAKPVGSGPFQYRESTSEKVVFEANPNYRSLTKLGLPYIREIHFIKTSESPEQDFAQGRLDLLLDLATSDLKRIDVPNVEVKTLRNRRIYFLAVNHHRVHPGLVRPELRRALAYAIDRTTILNNHFRGELKDLPNPPHRPLNGPYPPDSWASNRQLPPALLDPGLAKALAKQADNRVTITLKYPNDDPAVQKACEEIRTQIRAATEIDLQLKPLSPGQLWNDVEMTHTYDLAYYYFDFPNECYSLWPLFNDDPLARAAGGGNFLGYRGDATLIALLRDAMKSRKFEEVRQKAHQIHSHLIEQMPLIPLWQLDTHFAIHSDVQPIRLDPLRVFNSIEEWKKKSNK